jgi:hypothetical protein
MVHRKLRQNAAAAAIIILTLLEILMASSYGENTLGRGFG